MTERSKELENLPWRTAWPSGPCPFKVGDVVFYRPSYQGYGKTVMHGPTGQPKISQAVKIARIVQDAFIVYEGYDSPAGGIHWAEFSAE
jgi:hypothetical protein